MKWLGIDPGLSGAVALIDGAEITVFDMPTHEVTVNRKVKRVLDLDTLARWFDLNAAGITMATIEDVHSMPAQGIASSFTFGRVFGCAEAMLAAFSVPRRYVPPSLWKKAMRLSNDKDASRRLASQLFPGFAHLWSRKKDDGRAEAVLLAFYGSKTV